MKTDQNLTPAKTKSTTETASKLRKQTDEQIAEYARDLIDDATAGEFPNKMIPVATWAEKKRISTQWMERIFHQSRLAKEDYALDFDKSTDDKSPYREERGMIMIANNVITGYNNGAPTNQQFAIGQRFDVTLKSDRIILTPAI